MVENIVKEGVNSIQNSLDRLSLLAKINGTSSNIWCPINNNLGKYHHLRRKYQDQCA